MSTVKSKRQAATTAKAQKRSKAPTEPVGPLLRFTWVLLGWVIFGELLLFGLQKLDLFAEQPREPVPCRLQWSSLPSWLTAPGAEPLLMSIEDVAGIDEHTDAFDPNLCTLVADRLRTSPWIAGVQRVAKSIREGNEPVALLRIDAAFREPFAFVERGDTAYLIDNQGVRLPSTYVVAQVDPKWWDRWWRITGVAAPPPLDGEVWPGDDLADAILLVAFLNTSEENGWIPYRRLLRSVDVANYRHQIDKFQATLRIRLTTGDYYIHWGDPPGKPGVDSPPARKLEALRSEYLRPGVNAFADDIDVRTIPAPGPGRWWLNMTGTHRPETPQERAR